MTLTNVRAQAGSSSPAPANDTKKRKLWAPILLQFVAMIAIGALVYSSASDWFATRNHNSEVSGYVSAVEQLSSAEIRQKLQVAKDYNTHIPAGMLRDPYGADGDAALAEDAAYQAYTEVLRVSDSGVIGEMLYPRLNIGLPIYHGTGETAISTGVGHLYGSSLPVGGPSTHSVLTSHSGLVQASLFTRLPQAKIGDLFQVTVLGETHYYQVDGIETVEPFVTDSLAIVPGEDRVTLITCTPIGVNSHRLLVHGVRIADPNGLGTEAIAGDGRTAGFAWWALIFVGGSAAVGYLLFAPARPTRPSRTPRHATQKENHA